MQDALNDMKDRVTDMGEYHNNENEMLALLCAIYSGQKYFCHLFVLKFPNFADFYDVNVFIKILGDVDTFSGQHINV